jgi:hypothetical protein
MTCSIEAVQAETTIVTDQSGLVLLDYNKVDMASSAVNSHTRGDVARVGLYDIGNEARSTRSRP